MAEDMNVPEHQMLMRQLNAFELHTSKFASYTGPLDPESLKARTENQTMVESSEEGWLTYSPDGGCFASVLDDTVDIHNSETGAIRCQIHRSKITDIHFSPKGTFLVSWERLAPEGDKNVRIWNTTTGEEVRALHMQFKVRDTAWPVLRWTDDEELLWHYNTNVITVYKGADCTTKISALHQKGVEHFSLCPCTGSGAYKVATFLPEGKSTAAKVAIYEYPNLEQPKAQKNFFKATSALLSWSPSGMGVLINAKTDMDKTNESYYGESSLHLLLCDGSSFLVPFNNKGPVHDAKWSPQGTDFITIQGFQPAKITLFSATKCTAVRDFGTKSRNTIIWSPHGRFVCLAGFGNLAGEMDFWDKNKLKLMGSCQDMNGAKSFEFTPCGRYFITGVLWPKRRVDNGFKVWTYYGELVYHEPIERLAQVAIRPALAGVFPNKPMSPKVADRKLTQTKDEGKKAYVPPHLRGKTNAPSQIMKRVEDGPRKLNQLETQAARVEDKADKNKKRRERAKKRKEDEAEAEKAAELKAKAEVAHKKEAERAAAQARLDSMSDDEALAKKQKQLKKKIAAVDKLDKLKTAGTELDDAQYAKWKSGVALKKEMAEVVAALAALKA